MQAAFTRTGLTLGFYGGIAVLGWFYQIFFVRSPFPFPLSSNLNSQLTTPDQMPETKDKTLEEIDLVFQRSTYSIVAENSANAWETTKDLCSFRLRKVFVEGNTPRRASIVEQLAHHEKNGA